MNKKLEEYSREELIEEIKSLKRRKKFGLVWEDKKEDIVEKCKNEIPVLKEVPELAINEKPGELTNLIIEGDNFASLQVLNYTHHGKIDVIYIDPPYNTGNKDFIYNDSYVDSEDSFRHSKWLSFMDRRLRLAKELLSDDGVIFISIDDNEQAELKLLCDSVFGGDKFVSEFIIDKTAQGANQSSTFKTQHEFLLMYACSTNAIHYDIKSDVDAKKYKYEDKKGRYAVTNSFDSINSPLIDNRKRGYTVYYNEKTGDALVKDEYDSDTNTFGPYDDEIMRRGYVPIRPGIRKNVQYPWNWTSSRFEREYREELVFLKNKKGFWGIYHKNRATGLVKDTTIKRFDTRRLGNQILNDILGEKKFDYPKSIDMMKWVISKCVYKDAVVLDFFAGSGTTGQAVLELNKEDGGNRKFILCTNNESNIARDVTYPRIKTVVTGIRPDGSKYSDGISANVRYFTTGFIEKGITGDATRAKLFEKSDEMIQVRENTFEFVDKNDNYTFYKNNEKFVAIIKDPFNFGPIWYELEEKNTEKLPVKLYVFSYSNYTFEDEIPDTDLKYEICAIPNSIMEVYRKISDKKEER